MSNVVHLFDKPHVRTTNDFDTGKMYPINPSAIIKMSEKAICIKGHIFSETEPSRWNYSLDCWFPKSQFMGVYIPGWLFAAKAKAARQLLCNEDKFIDEADAGYVLVREFCIVIDEVKINLDDACTG